MCNCENNCMSWWWNSEYLNVAHSHSDWNIDLLMFTGYAGNFTT